VLPEQRPKHVDVENLPIIFLGLLGRRQIQCAFDAGIVDGEIEPSKGRDRLVHDGLDISLTADIRFNKQGFGTVGRLKYPMAPIPAQFALLVIVLLILLSGPIAGPNFVWPVLPPSR
jgi:hypothetical protein